MKWFMADSFLHAKMWTSQLFYLLINRIGILRPFPQYVLNVLELVANYYEPTRASCQILCSYLWNCFYLIGNMALCGNLFRAKYRVSLRKGFKFYLSNNWYCLLVAKWLLLNLALPADKVLFYWKTLNPFLCRYS